MLQKHLRVYLVCLIFLAYGLIGCGQLPLPISDCQRQPRSIAFTGRAIRHVGVNTPDFKIVGIPNARVELTSIQTTFTCPNASGADPAGFTTDAEGFFKGVMSIYDDDIFRLHITAEGCKSYEEEPVIWGDGLEFVLECE